MLEIENCYHSDGHISIFLSFNLLYVHDTELSKKQTLVGLTALDDEDEYDEEEDEEDIDCAFDFEDDIDFFDGTFGKLVRALSACSGTAWLSMPRRA